MRAKKFPLQILPVLKLVTQNFTCASYITTVLTIVLTFFCTEISINITYMTPILFYPFLAFFLSWVSCTKMPFLLTKSHFLQII